ncbi:hypothetical protein [Streptomyces sp. NPDC055105]|uniref:hypothetical protein n=1 Tax=Streptomyces sp. NPDC055105 TaxID=3365719 RepID=UPI0037D7D445
MPSDLRARLAAAAAQLKTDGHDDHAASVKAVLAPGGWRKLTAEPGTAATTRNLPVSVTEKLRARLYAAAENTDASLGPLATEGFRALAEGSWEPPAPVRAPRGSLSGERRVNMNLNIEVKAREDVEQLLDGLTKKFGRKVTLAHVALSWLREELGVDDD